MRFIHLTQKSNGIVKFSNISSDAIDLNDATRISNDITSSGYGYVRFSYNAHYLDWKCSECKARNFLQIKSMKSMDLNKTEKRFTNYEDEESNIQICSSCKYSTDLIDDQLSIRYNYDRKTIPSKIILFRLDTPIAKEINEKDIHQTLKLFDMQIVSIHKTRNDAIFVEYESELEAEKAFNIMIKKGVYCKNELLSFTFSKKSSSILDEIKEYEDWFSQYEYNDSNKLNSNTTHNTLSIENEYSISTPFSIDIKNQYSSHVSTRQAPISTNSLNSSNSLKVYDYDLQYPNESKNHNHILNRWIYDTESEYYYNYFTKVYKDIETGYIYDPEQKEWLFWEPLSKTFQSVEKATQQFQNALGVIPNDLDFVLNRNENSYEDMDLDEENTNFFGSWDVASNATNIINTSNNESNQNIESKNIIKQWREDLLSIDDLIKDEEERIIQEFKSNEQTLDVIGKPAVMNPEFEKRFQSIELEEQLKEKESLLDEELKKEISEAKKRILENLSIEPMIHPTSIPIKPKKKIPTYIQNLKNAKKIEHSNLGAQLLFKLGWKENTPIGKKKVGILEPVEIDIISNRHGIGYNESLEEKDQEDLEYVEDVGNGENINHYVKHSVHNDDTFIEKEIQFVYKSIASDVYVTSKDDYVVIFNDCTQKTNSNLQSSNEKLLKSVISNTNDPNDSNSEDIKRELCFS